ncbi:hypothetical protein NE237_030428 [Protea cynaroides]|uniref:Uncharacterized protein n=1 Tax=Protea cynaroides TaxID=273540 RepID=A0A9Q0JVS3_9MAGN|nr:hypothetical protein NE237_030428 [Protea cynaroides]
MKEYLANAGGLEESCKSIGAGGDEKESNNKGESPPKLLRCEATHGANFAMASKLHSSNFFRISARAFSVGIVGFLVVATTLNSSIFLLSRIHMKLNRMEIVSAEDSLADVVYATEN